MDREILKKNIRQINSMPEEILEKLANDFIYSNYKKKTLLIKENQLIKQSFFLESGYIRSYVIDQNGNEVTTNIFSSPSFVNDFSSFFKQSPAKQNFQTLTNCECWSMSLENIEFYFQNFSPYREFGRLLLLTHYDKLNVRMLKMIKDNAETRYLNLLSEHPDIFQNVPLKIIASYLGITDTSLSRIRKEISLK